jgi:DNA repair protein RadC
MPASAARRQVGPPRNEADLLLEAVGGRAGDELAARALLDEGALLERGPREIRLDARRHGFGPGQVRRLLAVCELARRWNVPVDASAPVISTPREALLQFQPLRASQRECFAVLYLNSRNQPVGYEQVAVGSLNVAAIQPREVFAPALQLAAAAVVVAHNHPSGDPTPSPEDLAVTRHLQEAGRLLGVEVLDHLVISADRFKSLREAGTL